MSNASGEIIFRETTTHRVVVKANGHNSVLPCPQAVYVEWDGFWNKMREDEAKVSGVSIWSCDSGRLIGGLNYDLLERDTRPPKDLTKVSTSGTFVFCFWKRLDDNKEGVTVWSVDHPRYNQQFLERTPTKYHQLVCEHVCPQKNVYIHDEGFTVTDESGNIYCYNKDSRVGSGQYSVEKTPDNHTKQLVVQATGSHSVLSCPGDHDSKPKFISQAVYIEWTGSWKAKNGEKRTNVSERTVHGVSIWSCDSGRLIGGLNYDLLERATPPSKDLTKVSTSGTFVFCFWKRLDDNKEGVTVWSVDHPRYRPLAVAMNTKAPRDLRPVCEHVCDQTNVVAHDEGFTVIDEVKNVHCYNKDGDKRPATPSWTKVGDMKLVGKMLFTAEADENSQPPTSGQLVAWDSVSNHIVKSVALDIKDDQPMYVLSGDGQYVATIHNNKGLAWKSAPDPKNKTKTIHHRIQMPGLTNDVAGQTTIVCDSKAHWQTCDAGAIRMDIGYVQTEGELRFIDSSDIKTLNNGNANLILTQQLASELCTALDAVPVAVKTVTLAPPHGKYVFNATDNVDLDVAKKIHAFADRENSKLRVVPSCSILRLMAITRCPFTTTDNQFSVDRTLKRIENGSTSTLYNSWFNGIGGAAPDMLCGEDAVLAILIRGLRPPQVSARYPSVTQ